MAAFGDADEGRRQHGSHRSGIDPAVGVAADRLIDRAMVHACAAADAAQHVLELAAQHCRAAIVENHDMIGPRTVGIARPARPGRQRRVDRGVLAGRRARQHAQELRGILERRHDFLDRGDDDMRLGQDLREIAIAFVGDDDRGSGFGNEKIRARDPDVGREQMHAFEA